MVILLLIAIKGLRLPLAEYTVYAVDQMVWLKIIVVRIHQEFLSVVPVKDTIQMNSKQVNITKTPRQCLKFNMQVTNLKDLVTFA